MLCGETTRFARTLCQGMLRGRSIPVPGQVLSNATMRADLRSSLFPRYFCLRLALDLDTADQCPQDESREAVAKLVSRECLCCRAHGVLLEELFILFLGGTKELDTASL